jgi:hypothetical protein
MPDQLAGFLKRHGDDALAGAITALALVGVALLDEPAGARLAIAASGVAVGVAAARRVRVPLLCLGLMVAIVVVTALRLIQVDTVDAFGLFLLLAVYSAAAHTSGRRTLVAGGLTVVLYISLVATDPNSLHADAVVFHALLFGAPWAAGRAVRRRRLSETRLEQERAKLDAAIVEVRQAPTSSRTGRRPGPRLWVRDEPALACHWHVGGIVLAPWVLTSQYVRRLTSQRPPICTACPG